MSGFDTPVHNTQTEIKGHGGNSNANDALASLVTEALDHQKELAKAGISWHAEYFSTGKITKDHIARIKSDREWEDLVSETKGTLCTMFYDGSNTESQDMKKQVEQLARSMHGKVTFAFVDSNEATEFIKKCRLGNKLPVIVLVDNTKYYMHFYPRMTDMSRLKRLIDRYDNGEKKEPN